MIFRSQGREWTKIVNLFHEQFTFLSGLGYPRYQLRSIVEEMLRGQKTHQLKTGDVMRIRSELDQYIEFAQNCYRSVIRE